MASMADPPAKALAPRTLVAEREKVVARLSDAFAHDRLNIEEFERRLTLAHERDTLAAINQLVDDLAEPEGEVRTEALAHTSDAREHEEITAIFGGSQFSGPQSLPRRLKIRAIFGGAQVDLRDAYSPTVSLTWKSKPCLAACRSSCPQPWQWSATEWRSSAASKASTARLRVPTRRRHCASAGTRGVRRRADRDTPARRGTARAPSPRRPPRPSRRAPRAAEQVDSHHPKQLFARSAHKNAFDAPGPIP